MRGLISRGYRRVLGGAAVVSLVAGTAAAQYIPTVLVSDGSVQAPHTDPNLVGAWGIAFDQNAGGFGWSANRGSGSATMYDGAGTPQPLVVAISAFGGGPGQPTGVVYNPTDEFTFSGNGFAGPATMLFTTGDGSIAAWSGLMQPADQAILVANNGADALYRGAAIASTASGARLYAPDFHSGRVDMFDGSFSLISGGFVDPNLPAGYAPFNVASIGDGLLVSYALQAGNGMDDLPGAGHGIIDEFDTQGNLLRRFAAQGALNSPWGMAVAPAGFGPFAGDLLVGNSGDGTINAYDLATGAFMGTLLDAQGSPIVIDGLRGLAFGNGFNGQGADSLYFTAGPDAGLHGLYGRIDVVPTPGAGVLLALAGAAWRRRR